MFTADKWPRVGIAIVLGLFVLSVGLDMHQNPDHYENRWAADVTQSYGMTLMGLAVLGVAGYLYRLVNQDETEEDEIEERTPVLVDEVSEPKGVKVFDRSQPLSPGGAKPSRVAFLVGVTGGVPSKVEIQVGRFIIGRSPNCDMVLSSQLVSRKHARLDWDGRVLKLTDLGSSNSTQVNDEDVKGERILQDGDIIQVVDYQMEVSLATPESLEATIIRPKES